jgi:hypothetical protein
LSYYDIKYVRYNIDVQEVENAVREEIEGPGRLLLYRAMKKKIREVHNLAVPRGLVHNVMGTIEPDSLERRGNVRHSKIIKYVGCIKDTCNLWVNYILFNGRH